MTRYTGWVLVASMLVAPSRALAQTKPTDAPTRWDELKAQADEDIQEGRALDALSKYSEIYGATRDSALHYNRARAYQMLGDYPEALAELERFRTEASPALRTRVPDLEGWVRDVERRVTKLEVICSVAGATVRLRDRAVGVTPLAQLRVNAGAAELEVTKDGFFPHRVAVTLPAGGTARLEVALAPRSNHGLLRITSPVVGAEVSVDHRTVGNAPTEVTLVEGAHEVEVSHTGYRTARSHVALAAGQSRQMDVALDPERSVFTRWWFWTGVGVVVAGGVTTAILLTQERSPGSGTLTPGRLDVGLWRF
jgi:hypothetical protein